VQQNTGDNLQGERGQYRAYEWVGGGGFGSVFFGRALRDSRPVAIKRLHPNYLHHASVVARFEREAALVLDYGLIDPNIVRILDRGRDTEATPFLVMEWVEGWTVSELLKMRGGPLTIAEAAAIGFQMLSGLAAAHARGVIHRDIKPANLMVTREGQVMVMDLGIAKEIDPEISGVTGFSGVPATLAYAAPEQLAGEPNPDGRTDVFALGATLYLLLTGVPAFSSVARDRLPPDVDQVRPEVPAELADLVRRAMGRTRAERFQSAHEMAEALRPFAPADLRVPVPSSEEVHGAPTPPTQTPSVVYTRRQPAWLIEARRLLRQGQLDQAVAVLTEAHRENPAAAATAYAETLRARRSAGGHRPDRRSPQRLRDRPGDRHKRRTARRPVATSRSGTSAPAGERVARES
jgi:serine/threonine protein kinase